MGIISLITGRDGPSGFGSTSTAEQVTEGIDASNLTAIITGKNPSRSHFHATNVYIRIVVFMFPLHYTLCYQSGSNT